MHGPIGFQPYWLKVQGYEGQNLLKLLADSCISRNIGVSAITSEDSSTRIIERNSVHDRLGYLKENFASGLPKNYETDMIGDNILAVTKGDRTVYFINGQTPFVEENGKRFDHLVIGSNEVPNFMNLEDTLDYCNSNGLLHGIEHPYNIRHFGVGEERALLLKDEYDFVEGHNSQLIFHRFFSKIPLIGKKLGPYSKTSNINAKKFALDNGKPWISTSDSHRIEDLGISSISFDANLLNISSESNFLSSLKSIISSGNFENNCAYESLGDWFWWVKKFKWGTSGKPPRCEKFELVRSV